MFKYFQMTLEECGDEFGLVIFHAGCSVVYDTGEKDELSLQQFETESQSSFPSNFKTSKVPHIITKR